MVSFFEILNMRTFFLLSDFRHNCPDERNEFEELGAFHAHPLFVLCEAIIKILDLVFDGHSERLNDLMRHAVS